LHLASRIPPVAAMRDPGAWAENDRLRADATRVLVDAAVAAGVGRLVVPTVTFVYPRTVAVDKHTPPADVAPGLHSALAAEAEVARFARAGGTGVVLRLGLLDGPGTGNARPAPAYGATVHVDDAGRALAAALDVPSGVYNVCRDGERVANARFKEVSGWLPKA
jgi:nucleoside-diphosphate-sugar epimerase